MISRRNETPTHIFDEMLHCLAVSYNMFLIGKLIESYEENGSKGKRVVKFM
jgi:hypothetical protein